MADILIRGMEMPKNCDKCKLRERNVDAFVPFDKCFLTKRIVDPWTFGRKDGYPDDCPLHELPEHGDLIDRDALKHKFCTHCDGYEYDTGACVDGDQSCMDAKIIMAAPVIVPSNKEETE